MLRTWTLFLRNISPAGQHQVYSWMLIQPSVPHTTFFDMSLPQLCAYHQWSIGLGDIGLQLSAEDFFSLPCDQLQPKKSFQITTARYLHGFGPSFFKIRTGFRVHINTIYQKQMCKVCFMRLTGFEWWKEILFTWRSELALPVTCIWGCLKTHRNLSPWVLRDWMIG